MIQKLVLATKNQDKVIEIQKILSDLGIRILPLQTFPNAPDVVEDGATLKENAEKKAKAIHNFTGLPAIADDTGLEVDYLNGAPGVYSSRYSGENATYAENVQKLLHELEGVPQPQRGAQFRCVVAFCYDHNIHFEEGICEGMISEQPKGEKGFGYDPVFYVPEFNLTFAEMDLQLKNRISHRAKAFLAFKTYLQSLGER